MKRNHVLLALLVAVMAAAMVEANVIVRLQSRVEFLTGRVVSFQRAAGITDAQ